MAMIDTVELRMVNLIPKVKRTDAIQSFVSQETPIVTITDADGAVGTGYSYTIGTGGSSVMRLIADHLAPRLIGRDADRIEAIWHELEFATHATTIGAITAIALAAIDTALWDLRARKQGLPLWKLAGGAKDRCPLYTTEGGWLHIETAALVEDALGSQGQGFPRLQGQDRQAAWRRGLCAALGRARRRRRRLRDHDRLQPGLSPRRGDPAGRPAAASSISPGSRSRWPPTTSTAIGGCRAATSTPIAIGESLYSIRHFREYMQKGACSIVQVDVGRIGGITPWLKVAHAAEAFDMPVCPHFLMELHVSLACAVPNGKYVEYIPQLDTLTGKRMRIEDGFALCAPRSPGWASTGTGMRSRRCRLPEFTTSVRRELMQRMGMVIGLKAGEIAEYKRLHAAVWPEVLARISACNIRNYTIFLKEPENLLVRYLGISRQRLRRRHGENGGRPQDAGMVGCLHAAAGAARNAQGRRMVGDDGGGLPP